MLQCNSITKRFGLVTALEDVTLGIPKGQIFGLLGPNGAGKTTLIRIINRMTVPTSGEVFLDGVRMTDEMVRSLGYLPEERGLYKKAKVGEQALYLARLRGMSRHDAMEAIKEWFVRLGIEAWWGRKVEELSKGMAQKVQFVTTVIHRPRLLILDEPFSGFDPVNVQIIRDEILRLRDEGTTVILSTHNMESVEELCDSIALIHRSKLMLSGSTDDVRRRYGPSRVELRYRSAAPLTDLFPGEDGPLPFRPVSDETQRDCRRSVLELDRETPSNEVLRTLIDRVDVLSYSEIIPRMNDIFINLVTDKEDKK